MANQVRIAITGDASKFTSAIDAAEGKTKSFGDKFGGVATAVVAGGLVIGAAAVAIGLKVFEAGAQFEAMDAKARTVFGSSLGGVEKWAAANAGAMGLTQRSAIGLAASMGDLLVPIGFTRDQAAAMSTEIVGLSGALSEWSGGTRTASEVSAVLQKALLGEREGLKELGISITEADVKQQLLKEGKAGLTGESLAQAKAEATLALVLAKSTDAQAAYAEGTAKGLRTQNEMKAKLGEVSEKLQTALYPILVTVAGFLAENLPKAIQFAQEAWQNIQPVVSNVAGVIGSIASVAIPAVVTAVGVLVAVFKAAWTVASAVADGIAGAFTNIVGAVKGVLNALIRAWNGLKFTIPSFEVPFFGKVGGFSVGTPDIPYLHRGGIVPGIPGSNVPAMLQAGEMVVPRSALTLGGQGGRSAPASGGQPVVIQFVVDGRVLSEIIDRRLYYSRGARGSLPAG